ncbi:MAG: ABC transporter permease [Planctomycetes bacterium]|nr:ABC transporter permease [Planctomycetota bacterium]
MRSFLVLQGVVWGVAVAVLAPAVLEGSRRAAVERAASLGTDRVAVRGERGSGRRPLEVEDLEALRGRFRGDVTAASGAVVVRRRVEGAGGREARLAVIATDPWHAQARALGLERGRFLEEADVAGRRRVCVLEPEAARALFGEADPVGGTLLLRATRDPGAEAFQVVGLVARRDPEELARDDFGFKRDHRLQPLIEQVKMFLGIREEGEEWKRDERGLYLPLGAVEVDRDGLDWVFVRSTPERVLGLVREVRGLLVERGTSPLVFANSLWPILAGEEIRVYERLNLVVFASTLFMGSVVIMNLMLMSVMERWREVAIRRAEGATRAHVAAQFVAESAVLSLVGAALGVPAGMGLAWLRVWIEPNALMTITFPGPRAALAVALAVVSGVAAGSIPAWRAARIDPVEALRHE